MLPSDLLQLGIDIPEKLQVLRIDARDLPRNWRSYPAQTVLQRRGDDWLAAGSTAVLEVPSAVIPQEFNLLINPQHPDARKIRVMSIKDFAYDSRLTS
jgi:RES domain-containing protein